MGTSQSSVANPRSSCCSKLCGGGADATDAPTTVKSQSPASFDPKRPTRAQSFGSMASTAAFSLSPNNPHDDVSIGSESPSGGANNNSRPTLAPVPETSADEEAIAGPESDSDPPRSLTTASTSCSPQQVRSPFTLSPSCKRVRSPLSLASVSTACSPGSPPGSYSPAIANGTPQVRKKLQVTKLRLSGVLQENDILKQALHTFHTHTVRAYEQQLSVAAEHLRFLQKELERVTVQKDRLQADSKGLPAWVSCMQRQSATKDDALAELMAAKAELEKEVTTLQRIVDEEAAKRGLAQQHVRHLRRKLDAVQAKTMRPPMAERKFPPTPVGTKLMVL